VARDGVQVDRVHGARGIHPDAAGDGVDGRLAHRAGECDVARDAVGVRGPGEAAHLNVAGDGVQGQVARVGVDDDVAGHGVQPGIIGEAGDERAGADDPEVQRNAAGDSDADFSAGSAGTEVAEHLEEVVPAQLRVVDLDLGPVGLDAEVFHGHAAHFDADAGFVVGDDVDLSADEPDLESGRLGDVDDTFFAGGDEPLLGHGVLLNG